MKTFLKQFSIRGLMFAGLGPIIYAIAVLLDGDSALNALVVFKGIITIYLMVFIVAGSSCIWQIERLGVSIAILIHGGILYLCYLITYLVNGWLEKNLSVIGIFTIIFVVGYLLIVMMIYLAEKRRAKSLNMRLK